MKVRWQTKKLGDIAEVQSGGTPLISNKAFWNGYIPWYSSGELNDLYTSTPERYITESGLEGSNAKLFPAGSLLIGMYDTAALKMSILDRAGAFNQAIAGVKPNEAIDLTFVLHAINSMKGYILSQRRGVRQKNLSLEKIRGIELSFPPLPEQQRIVAILDEAFDGIATAKANAEKNLQNARALFESHLQVVFTQRGAGWEEKKIGEIAKHSLGKMLDKAKNKGEPQRYLRNVNVRWFRFDLSDLLEMRFLPEESTKYTASKGDVLVCEGGYPGRAAIWDEDYPIYFQKALHRIRFHEPEYNRWFVYFLYIQDKSGELRQHFTGTGIQHFTGEVLSRFQLPIAPLPELRRLIARFEELAVETQHLESLYRKKLAALDDLKNSLLHKAFAGELTRQSPRPVVIPFPTRIPNITSTDLHAGILAMAFQLHEKRGLLKHFGHVKAEKIAHMIEAKVGIDLGRTPVKAAAGPNDYPHLKRVEHRARMAGFFDFRRVQGGRYSVKKCRHFERLIERTREKLGDRCPEVDNLLQLMLPMDTLQAELFCTVYAAWNNLLLDSQQITDESIVFEARENWHPDKLSIPREQFFAAINFLREKGVIPVGKGKKVTAKARKQ